MSIKSTARTLVLTYGTLKFPERNHARFLGRAVKSGRARFLGVTTTLRPYVMLEYESQTSPGKKTPGVVLSRKMPKIQAARIEGELYAVTLEVLKKLDILEQVGKNYRRVVIECVAGQRAHMYIKLATNGQRLIPVRKNSKLTYSWNERRGRLESSPV
jgi:gamma-glutamylcyclotransferase (GGCT)/AIG2-like uncharacterized protein YtfP